MLFFITSSLCLAHSSDEHIHDTMPRLLEGKDQTNPDTQNISRLEGSLDQDTFESQPRTGVLEDSPGPETSENHTNSKSNNEELKKTDDDPQIDNVMSRSNGYSKDTSQNEKSSIKVKQSEPEAVPSKIVAKDFTKNDTSDVNAPQSKREDGSSKVVAEDSIEKNTTNVSNERSEPETVSSEILTPDEKPMKTTDQSTHKVEDSQIKTGNTQQMGSFIEAEENISNESESQDVSDKTSSEIDSKTEFNIDHEKMKEMEFDQLIILS